MLFREAQYLTTGSLKLDLILRGGYSKGSVVEICGGYASAKTLLALTSCIYTDYVTYIDFERCISRAYLENTMQLELDKLIVCQPRVEELHATISHFSKISPIIIVDSTACIYQSRNFIAKIKRIITANQCILILLSQLRNSPDGQTYSTGGAHLKAWCDDRILLTKGRSIKQGYRNIGREIGVSILKSRRGNGCKFIGYAMKDAGWAIEIETIDMLLAMGFAKRSGSFIEYEGVFYKGKIGFYEALKEIDNFPLGVEIRERILNGYRPNSSIFKRHNRI